MDLLLDSDQERPTHNADELAVKADKGDVTAMIQLAELKESFGDDEAAFALYLQAARAGSDHVRHHPSTPYHPQASTVVGFMLTEGVGCSKDESEGSRYTEKAARAGDAQARSNLGVYFLRHRRYKRAMLWFSRAAATRGSSQPDAVHRAEFYIGQLYRHGRGVRSDAEAACVWLRKAADGKHAQARCNLGAMMYSGSGVVKDVKAAARLFELSANGGVAEGACNLAAIYARGDLGKPDPDAANRWYVKAAEGGSARARFTLGSAALSKGDEREAFRLWRLSADQGHAPSMYELGVLLMQGGDGVERDGDRGRALVQEAAKSGQKQAIQLMAELDAGKMMDEPQQPPKKSAWEDPTPVTVMTSRSAPALYAPHPARDRAMSKAPPDEIIHFSSEDWDHHPRYSSLGQQPHSSFLPQSRSVDLSVDVAMTQTVAAAGAGDMDIVVMGSLQPPTEDRPERTSMSRSMAMRKASHGGRSNQRPRGRSTGSKIAFNVDGEAIVEDMIAIPKYSAVGALPLPPSFSSPEMDPRVRWQDEVRQRLEAQAAVKAVRKQSRSSADGSLDESTQGLRPYATDTRMVPDDLPPMPRYSSLGEVVKYE